MKINRREILKLSAGAIVATFVSPFISAQPGKASGTAATELAAARIDGNISYNAGWVVPLEDKAGLLEIEARKTKERDELAKQKAGVNADPAATQKETPKSIGKRFQEMLSKVKSYF